jgi:hypothetical protein
VLDKKMELAKIDFCFLEVRNFTTGNTEVSEKKERVNSVNAMVKKLVR